MLFVTAFIGVLDLESGELAYCNAGHDNPYALLPGRAPMRLAGGDGPGLMTGLAELERPLELAWLLEEDGELFARYRVIR